jgi:DNA-binding protein
VQCCCCSAQDLHGKGDLHNWVLNGDKNVQDEMLGSLILLNEAVTNIVIIRRQECIEALL